LCKYQISANASAYFTAANYNIERRRNTNDIQFSSQSKVAGDASEV